MNAVRVSESRQPLTHSRTYVLTAETSYKYKIINIIQILPERIEWDQHCITLFRDIR